ncbi:DUF1127 domain-containing protein [Aliishimia ponticola]|uniref:DUF1127 domain-containing protein n=1 Tax=Aliishimia ponticola TaxID=2499833 RepID=A0A4S4NFM9_9RHOB|nr:DUF1127 domain-containing protein [Aliishimia ponticola]THH38406.1 DUF1127 domain-containing protein [Aliishimia ponticola]
MTQTHQTHALHYLSDRPLTPVSTLALQLVVIVVKWEERRRTRKQLNRLEHCHLNDIGITARDARREARKPFWIA